MSKLEFKGTKGDWFIDEEESHLMTNGVYCNVISSENVIDIADVYGDTEESKANAKLISNAKNLYYALHEINIDLKILKTNFIQIEKVDSKAEGMIDLIQKWIERNNEVLLKSL